MPASHYYNRPALVLPPADSLPYPANLVVECSECGLRNSCTRPVPAENVEPCEIMFVGEAPGFNEDREGRPFIGQAGRYLDSLLFQCGISRELVCVSNSVHCRPPNNRIPKIDEIRACSKWLELELDIVQPRIVVALGKPATDWFLPRNNSTMEHMHGKPVEEDGRIILPCYHPAFALRDTSKMRQVSEDFQVLRGLVNGKGWQEYHVVDEYPNPKYIVVNTPDKVKMMEYLIEQAGEFAVDTEQCRGKLWSVQISCKEGEAYFIPIKGDYESRVDLSHLKATAIVHYYLHDIQYVKLDEANFVDTMTMAYLVGQSQGLKELASRLCGVNMLTYRETTRSGQDKLSLEYLLKASGVKWSDPPPVEETKWNNKKGELVTRTKKPWHISRKINNILSDYGEDSNTDLWDRWQKIPDIERSVVESELGIMPESSLMDIPLEDAVRYSCRDADVTLRVKHELDKMIADLGLELVLQTDLRVLPLVRSMMDNGIAIDVDHCRRLSEEYDVKLRVIATQLSGMVGHPFNPNSSKQVAEVIYKELGFKPTKFTDTKEISTDDAELKKTGPHPVAKEIIHYRGILKLKTTYADNMIRSAHPDDTGVPRMHTKINTTRVETGRLSSSKTDDGEGANFQNIPTRNKDGRDIKDGFIAPIGRRLGEADLGQVEMRTQTHLAKCKGLIDLFHKEGDEGDPHTVTASRLFGVPLSEARLSKYRYPCKRAGFGIIYMIGAKGLSTQINEYIADLEMAGEPVDVDPWDEPTCQKFIDEYYKLYPEIRDYQQEMLAHARRFGYVKDIFGRVRFIPEVSCPISHIQEAGARMASNMPVTSSAQEVIKSAMGEIWEQLPRTPWADTKMLIQIHDSLLFEYPDDSDYEQGLFGWVNEIMTSSVSLIVPLTADFKTGRSWGSLKELELVG